MAIDIFIEEAITLPDIAEYEGPRFVASGFDYVSEAAQTYTVLDRTNLLYVYLFGAGGGLSISGSAAGAGGYTMVAIPVVEGDVLSLYVASTGQITGGNIGGCGGGASAVEKNGTLVAIAGGGAGAAIGRTGAGAGGGFVGQPSSHNPDSGGTQSSGGLPCSNRTAGTAGTQFNGGNAGAFTTVYARGWGYNGYGGYGGAPYGDAGGSGGGAGYWGGGGGCNDPAGYPGGGGSSYINMSLITDSHTEAGSYATPPEYTSDLNLGSQASPGNHGYIFVSSISLTPPTLFDGLTSNAVVEETSKVGNVVTSAFSTEALAGVGWPEALSEGVLINQIITYWYRANVAYSDLVEVNEGWLEDVGIVLRDGVSVVSAISSTGHLGMVVGEFVKLLDQLSVTFGLALHDQLVAVAATNGSYAAKIAEALNSAADISTALYAVGRVDQAVRIFDACRRAIGAATGAYLSGTSIITTQSLSDARALEQLQFSSTSTYTSVLVVVAASNARLDNTVTPQQVLRNFVEDNVTFIASFVLPDGEYIAWGVTPETTAAYKYTNYPFNSFAKVGTSFLACASDGLYELAGDTDDGTQIDAHIKTGLMDFGSAQLKHINRAYLGYTSDGRIMVKSYTTESGTVSERWYELIEPQAHAATREARVKMARGVKARYWQFALHNRDGADFEVDDFKILPVILTRKV